MNEIKPRTIDSLIRNKDTKGDVECYSIPSYQRGYRWTKYQVLDLLDDVFDFMSNRGSEFYCLQPVVVKKRDDESWELLDGQQRLITIYIILHYLDSPCYEIGFDKRPTSKKFLSELSTLIDGEESVSNPDYYFIRNAYTTIKNWFEEKIKEGENNRLKSKFTICLMEDVKVIWYHIMDHDANDLTHSRKVFNRLNTGKIPLTDSELIKATLLQNLKLQNAAQKKLLQYAKRTGVSGTYEEGIAEGNKAGRASSIRQAELAGEWDRIEQSLQQDEFWYFLTDSEEYDYPARIELILRLIAGESKLPYGIYRYFNHRIENNKESVLVLWKEIKDYFQTFQGWYHDRELYHLVGYMLVNKFSITELYKWSSENKKNEFRKLLKNKIKVAFSSVQIDTIEYGNNDTATKILLLFNIISLQSSKNITALFPFFLYKGNGVVKNKWSLEHIHAQASKPLNGKDAMRSWLKEARKSIAPISEIIEETTNDVITELNSKSQRLDKIKQKIDKIIDATKIDDDDFMNIQEELIQIFDSGSIHFLDNLALLQTVDNASIGNQIFPVKRNKIMELEKSGAFIPLCTRNVFLKYYTTSPSQPYFWSQADRIEYIEEIKKVLKKYLPKQIVQSEEKKA